jgi:type III secretion system YopN/LcrE/InvE/MxiC family regulator
MSANISLDNARLDPSMLPEHFDASAASKPDPHHDNAPAPATGKPLPTPRGTPLGRKRPADLYNRFGMVQLRRMNRMAFGQGANNMLSQQANEAVAELEGTRAPAALAHESEGDEALRRYIVLREALEIAEAGGAEKAPLREKIEQAIDRLVSQHGDRIVGDLNISGTLERFSGLIRERDKMRRLYHDAICNHSSIAQTYDALLKAFGPEQAIEAVKTLGHALKEDMLSPLRSADPKFLGSLFSELQRVTTLLSMFAASGSLDKVFPSLRKVKVRGEFLAKMLHIVIEGGAPAQLKQVGEWLCSAPQADDPDPLPDPSNPKALADMLALQQRREEAVRRFLLHEVPAHLWKPNARLTTTAYGR